MYSYNADHLFNAVDDSIYHPFVKIGTKLPPVQCYHGRYLDITVIVEDLKDANNVIVITIAEKHLFFIVRG